MTAPLVSVILPTWNRAAFLRQAVESVFRQTEQNWELIVADDGSTDETAGYLQGIADPRVRVVGGPHHGHPGAVRNRALAHGRAPLVAFLDSDDWWEPEKLALQLRALAENARCGWSFTWYRFVDEAGRDLPSVPPPPLHGGAMILEELVSGEVQVLTPTVVVRRDVLEQLGGFDDTLVVASDFDLWTRLADCSPVAPVGQVLAVRRRHAGHYNRAWHRNRELFELVFARLLARTSSPRIRRLVRVRRAQWLIKVASNRRGERHYAEAWSALFGAGWTGMRFLGWWWGALRGLLHPLIPPRLLTTFKPARKERDGSAR